ncbi:AAA family ATPase [Thorsellia anophelis]|uniref:ATPase AAA-type core domain-containing protein n=1 Tax=Thorsellia anophelis DSM 18579 TaxID=1123402 RepID=A0A1I0G267_9GAMM|nr:ATP-binding protein [Thorsellia anophelis]SET64668.1 hypothetical protein SAMN02583745_02961 [Thorsellia anophelis DSM 18579]
MIISFTIQNWMSFREPVHFSMIASKEKQHRERIAKISKYQTSVLPIAAIYGGNASGKTNFFKALNFVKWLVVRGTSPDSIIPVETYRLDSLSQENPSRFKIELLKDEIIYEFSFAVTQHAILEEKLIQITSTSEKVLYDRQGDNPNFYSGLNKDMFLHFAFKGTRDNQLFLTNSITQKIETFRPIYDWFKDTLELVAPDSRFESFEHFLDEAHPLYNTMNQLLPKLDTGISQLGSEEIPFDNTPFTQAVKNKIKEDVKEGVTIRLLNPSTNERFIITRKSGQLVAKKLVSFHSNHEGEQIQFDIRQESDGSQRVIDLLPAFLELSDINSKKVYVIDEVDRSLHSLLTWQLLEAYLSNCTNDSRSQLLVTTHDILLMDQKLLRRDEMWVTERSLTGCSHLISFSDYKDIRYDKNIQKSYLQGRLGGIPKISLIPASNQKEE